MDRPKVVNHSHTTKHKSIESKGTKLLKFETWQIVLSIIQCVILSGTIYVAWHIGSVQNNINQQLLDLNFRPSLEVTSESDKLNVYNRGKDNVWLWGTQFRDETRTIESSGRLIAPGGFYYLFSNKL